MSTLSPLINSGSPASYDSSWIVLQDGRSGTDGQAIGLMQAMKTSYVSQSLNLPAWCFWLPPQVISPYVAEKLYHACTQPPVGVIGAGRRASYGLLAARQRWPGITTIQIQDPHIDPKNFTYMVVPEHDDVHGPNVITTMGGLHRVNDIRLAEARAAWQEKLSAFHAPRVAVLIGGNNKSVRLDLDWADDVIAKCTDLLARGASLWMTVSRRTPLSLRDRLYAALANQPHVWFWDGTGENPYLGFLAMADFILVTSESVSMISESLATPVPVALLRMPGAENSKFARFHRALLASGQACWYDNSELPALNNGPQHLQRNTLRETARVAEFLLSRLI